jgi:hypothetical protein
LVWVIWLVILNIRLFGVLVLFIVFSPLLSLSGPVEHCGGGLECSFVLFLVILIHLGNIYWMAMGAGITVVLLAGKQGKKGWSKPTFCPLLKLS